MATLRFRSSMIEPVLTGAKTSTYRRDVASGVQAGAVIDAACRYDEPPFAQLLVRSVDAVLVRELDVDKRRELKLLYPGTGAVVRVDFELVSPTSATALSRSSASPQ